MSGTVGHSRETLALAAFLWVSTVAPTRAAEPASFVTLDAEFARSTRATLKTYCLDCHSTEDHEGDLDLERFQSVADLRKDARVWQKVVEQLDNGEMPPKDAETALPPDERAKLRGWVGRYLKAEAYATAGDPGPVVLRRLNNAEYTYTLRDLTGVALSPAREFPSDGAAGEGFTNTGNALVMSPALLGKYLDAAKDVAAHAVLLQDGIRFSPATTRRDWTDEALHEIRALYARHADADGKLPLAKYLAATLEEREALAHGTKTVAQARGLNARYLEALWTVLNGNEPSPVLDGLRAHWRAAKAQPADVAALVNEVALWQQALAKFQNVGHMKSWVVPVNPVSTRQDMTFKFSEAPSGGDVTVYLATSDAGDGHDHDVVVWQRPRLVAAGRPDLPLRDVRDHVRAALARRERVFQTAARCLTAAAEAIDSQSDRATLAKAHDVDADILGAWLDFLGIGPGATIRLDLLKARIERGGNYDFVQGWGSPDLPSLLANSTDQHVRIPGNMKGHGVVVHPTPTLAVAAGWKSPATTNLKIEGTVTHAHPECGNGVAWSLELRRGATRQRLAAGIAQGPNPVKVGPVGPIAVHPGDLVSLVIGPRDGNHSCDLTDLELNLAETGEKGRTWNLTRDVAGDVLAGNPHADQYKNADVWQFYKEPVQGGQGPVIPAGSLLARWLASPEKDQKRVLADAVQKLLTTGPPPDKNHPDALLHRQLASLGGPLLASLGAPVTRPDEPSPPSRDSWGLDPSQFGRLPDGTALDPLDLATTAPSVIAVRLPADLAAGCDLVASAVLRPSAHGEASAQVRLLAAKPDALTGLRPDAPVLVAEGSTARARMEKAFDDFRRWFPAALCYTKIVPVDEVVTLTLFHREDEPLRRLMLSDAETARLDRVWNDLHFVSRDALTLVDAFAQLMEYATQDSDPKLFEPFRKPINDRAAAYRQAVLDAEPKQIDAVVAFAARAYRRPLTATEASDLRGLYRTLRTKDVPHEEAARLTLARVLVAPAFLYRIEAAGPGAQPSPVSDWELATRLSYFLWSSCPDDELRGLAASGRLHEPEILAAQARRMLKDDKVRRLATEFACQWLHVYEFDTLDEKSERHFPDFAALRGDMYEETIRFFQDLCQRDAPASSIFDADVSFLNERMAKLYSITGVTGPEWRRVDGLRAAGRGGILGLATTLAKQSGASRTSPILRGNWVSEVLLGEKLPKPPKGVPVLPDDEAASGGLSVRQLVEKHSRDARCASCHIRIDGFGFALEGFDAIGRRRDQDLGGHAIDTRSKAPDGAALEGLEGLRRYLLTTRHNAVYSQFSRKLLGYALGRGVRLSDDPLIDDLKRRIGDDHASLSVIVSKIVLSPQFRDVRGREAGDAP
jgi:Protein of unknown function (DUF1592)/Protein of unknown function (DUF1588)/Protein of unknown function (DUF1587)/Protein of unknown function (DUF1585)/Protein of unknown function (DUF1595)/Planctomycete cytochrome C